MIKIGRFIFVTTCLFFLMGCATVFESQKSTCHMPNSRTLQLVGDTDEVMLTCVRSLSLDNVERIVVNTKGGRVDTAIQIAQIIAPLNAHLVVDGKCNSSCANYFLPVSRKVTLLNGAHIILHGGIDPGFVERHGQGPFNTNQLQTELMHKYNIPKGWLFYRETKAEYMQGLGKHVRLGTLKDSSFKNLLGSAEKPLRGILVEEAFIKSCFPDLELENFKQFKTASSINRLERQDIYLSNKLKCVTYEDGQSKIETTKRFEPTSAK